MGRQLSKKTVVEKLLDFGFSNDEAEIYFFLLRTGPCPASLISRRLRFNRVKAYRILKALEEKGAVGAIIGRPTKFVATPLEKMTEQLLEEKKKTILEMEESRDEIVEYWRKIQTGVEALEEPRFRILQGRKQIYDFLIRMFERAETEICILTTRNDLQRFSFYGVSDPLESGNLAKRLLTQVDRHGIETIEDLLDFAEVRHIPLTTAMRLVIVDGSEVLNTFAMEDSMSMTTQRDIGLWTNAHNYVESMKVFFSSLWSAAPDARQVSEAVKAGKVPQRISIIGTLQEYNETYKAMIESSKEEAIIIEKDISRTPLSIRDMQEIMGRGVKVKFLTQVDLSSIADVSLLARYAEVRHRTDMPELQLLVVDQREVLVRVPHLKTYGYTTWSNLEPHVETMMQIFRDKWTNSVPATEILPKLATEQKLLEGLRLAEKSLQASDWITEVPGQLATTTGSKISFTLVAKHKERPLKPLTLDLLVEEDALGQIVELKAKARSVGASSQILASTRPFYKEESKLADLYGITLIYAIDPDDLATKIANEAKRVLEGPI